MVFWLAYNLPMSIWLTVKHKKAKEGKQPPTKLQFHDVEETLPVPDAGEGLQLDQIVIDMNLLGVPMT